jgi:hypothetical protein
VKVTEKYRFWKTNVDHQGRMVRLWIDRSSGIVVDDDALRRIGYEIPYLS